MKKAVLFFVSCFLFLVFSSHRVRAVNIGDIFEPAKKFPTLGDLLNILLPNVLLIAGVILFILILAGGFMILKGAGSGDAQSAEKGQKAATFAVIGFVIIFVSYFVIQLIELVTGINIFNPGF